MQDDYGQAPAEVQTYRVEQHLTEENLQLTEFFQSFGIPAPQVGGYYAADLTLDVPDLLDRLELLGERLKTLSKRIVERGERVRNFKERLTASLQYLVADFEAHKRAWWMAESNPSAAGRRTFLQQELLRLQEHLYAADLDSVDRTIELERERDHLLLEYVQLRRVAQAIRG